MEIVIKDKKLFGKQFKLAYDEWKSEEQGRTQETFIKLFDDKISRQTVSSWRNGRAIPSEYHFDRICEIFGKPEEYFSLKGHMLQYAGSTEFMNLVMTDDVKPYCETIGLDEDFLRFLKSFINFDELFPLWRPMKVVMDGLEASHYELASEVVLPKSAPMTDSIFQIRREVKTPSGETEERLLTFLKPDLLFLRDVQKDVFKYVEFLFMKRQREMFEEIEEANKRTVSPVRLKDGGRAIRRLTKEELLEVSPYARAFEEPEE